MTKEHGEGTEPATMVEKYEAACAEITQLRGNLSLAEGGLANYAQEVEQLKILLGAATCPNRSAPGHEGAWQCQWCDERKSALSASHEPGEQS